MTRLPPRCGVWKEKVLKTAPWACFGLIAVVGTLLVVSPATAESLLGQLPLCEASSALMLPCPGATGECLVVSDNEHGEDLFLFSVRDGELHADSQETLPLQGEDLSDIEALARVSSDEILIFGSHSRTTTCQAKKKRRQFAAVHLAGKTVKGIKTVQSKEIQCDRLFDELSSGDAVVKVEGTKQQNRSFITTMPLDLLHFVGTKKLA